MRNYTKEIFWMLYLSYMAHLSYGDTFIICIVVVCKVLWVTVYRPSLFLIKKISYFRTVKLTNLCECFVVFFRHYIGIRLLIIWSVAPGGRRTRGGAGVWQAQTRSVVMNDYYLISLFNSVIFGYRCTGSLSKPACPVHTELRWGATDYDVVSAMLLYCVHL